MAIGEEDTRDLSNLLIDQIEFSNVIILNKMDLVTEEQVTQLQDMIFHLNPSAQIIKTTFSVIDLNRILNTGLFDFNKAVRAPGWIKELQGEHTPETQEYGFTSFVYRRRKAFNPAKLHELLLTTPLKGVVRSKGFFWVGSDNTNIYQWSSAGVSFRSNPVGVSFVSLLLNDLAMETTYA